MTTVLAVDDSTSMRQMLAHTLRVGGYDVLEAADGAEALERLAGRDVAAVITDQNMPRLDGLALTRKLREQSRYSKVPVLILTTESSDDLRQAGRAAGATGWLQKPFEPQRLLDVLAKVAPITGGLGEGNPTPRWAEKGPEARRGQGSSQDGLTPVRNDAYGPLSAQPEGRGPATAPCVVTDLLESDKDTASAAPSLTRRQTPARGRISLPQTPRSN